MTTGVFPIKECLWEQSASTEAARRCGRRNGLINWPDLTLSGAAFSVVRQARGAQRPACQKSKLTSTNCNETVKCEDDSSSSFGDMTSQDFPQMKGTSHKIRLFTPRKRI